MSLPPTSSVRCPICKLAAAPATTPFCSSRCAELDLGRWFTGRYAAPAAETDDPADDILDAYGEE